MVGEELRKARLSAGFTQEQLAFKAGLSREYISILERNQKSPTIDVLFRICDAVKVKASRLIGRVEHRQQKLHRGACPPDRSSGS